MLIYSAGLRLAEAIDLKVEDLQPSQNRLYVRAGKGKKDRCTLFSSKVWEPLSLYLGIFKPMEWVFEGPNGGQYSERSVQEVFTKAKNRAIYRICYVMKAAKRRRSISRVRGITKKNLGQTAQPDRRLKYLKKLEKDLFGSEICFNFR